MKVYFDKLGGAFLDTTFELVKSARYFMQGHSDDFWRIYEMSVDDMYYQLLFVVCDEVQTEQLLEKLYIYFVQNSFLLENPEDYASWMNETVSQFTADWLKENRQNMLMAEASGAYAVPVGANAYLPGNEIDDLEYIRTLENYICNLPEIHRQTALMFYFDNLPMEKMEEILQLSATEIRNRIGFIEKTLDQQMQAYCKDRGYSMKNVDAQKILRALSELAKLYRYMNAEATYNNIRIKAIH